MPPPQRLADLVSSYLESLLASLEQFRTLILPTSSACANQNHLVVTLAGETFRQQICIELNELQCLSVRSGGALCLLGIGLGLGTLYAYRFASKQPRYAPARGKCQSSHLESQHPLNSKHNNNRRSPELETPSDSGFSSDAYSMGAAYSADMSPEEAIAAHYTSGRGVSLRGLGRGDGILEENIREPDNASAATRPRQLYINIPGEGRRRRDGSDLESSMEVFDPLMDPCSMPSSHCLTPGTISMAPNYSPQSLYEKNIYLSDSEEKAHHSSSAESRQLENLFRVRTSDGDQRTRSFEADSAANTRQSFDRSTGHEMDCRNIGEDLHLRAGSQSGNVCGVMDPFNLTFFPETNSANNGVQNGASTQTNNLQTSSTLDISTEQVRDRAIERIRNDSGASNNGKTGLDSEGKATTSTKSSPAHLSLSSSPLNWSVDVTRSPSFDVGDSNSGLDTPECEVFKTVGDIGLQTTEHIEALSSEVHIIQEEINAMTNKIHALGSKLNQGYEDSLSSSNVLHGTNDSPPQTPEAQIAQELGFHSEASLSEGLRPALRILHRHRSSGGGQGRMHHRSVSFSDDAESDVTALEIQNRRSRRRRKVKSHNHSSEFMWDYGCDLASSTPTGCLEQFVAQRPLLGRPATKEEEELTGICSSNQKSKHDHSLNKSVDSKDNLTQSLDDLYLDDEVLHFKTYNVQSVGLHSGSLLAGRAPSAGSDNQSSAATSDRYLPPTSLSDTDDMPDSERLSPEGSEYPLSLPTDTTPESSPAKVALSSHVGFCLPTVTIPELDTKPTRVNIGAELDVLDYVQKEWRGETPLAQRIQQGYSSIPKMLNFSKLRVIRGDNYCAIRATVFQILSNQLPACRKWTNHDQLLKVLKNYADSGHSYLYQWSFGKRLTCKEHGVLNTLADCIMCLVKLIDTVLKWDAEAVMERISSLLNDNRDLDIILMEGVKAAMMLNALDLHKQMSSGGDVPTFAWLMFAREDSDSPENFFWAHLNKVGGEAGLEQVEMLLLSHTLDVTVNVVHPSKPGQDDYVTTYGDEDGAGNPAVYLIADDDRHYNVLFT